MFGVRFLTLLLLIASHMATSGCTQAFRESVGGVPDVHHRIYLTDFNTAWQAVLESLSSVKIDAPNKEAGFLQTRWTDNTLAKNFMERGSFMKAQFRFQITVAKGFFEGKPSVKVSVQKEQLIQRDVLEGWRRVDSDAVEEKTLLYRIGRVIYVKTQLAKIEEQKIRKQLESSDF